MTTATRVPYQPADFAEYLDAHDDFHLVGFSAGKRVDPYRSTNTDYSLRVIVSGGKLYFADFAAGVPDGVTFKDGVYQPIVTGLEAEEDPRAGGPSLTPSGTPIDLTDGDLA